MSHFTVLVIGPEPEKQLAPFHEFECTGTDNEFVQAIDQTKEARAEYKKQTITRFKDRDGNLHDPHGDEFYRDPTPAELKEHGPMVGIGSGYMSKDWGDGRGYRPKVQQLPKGWKEVEVSIAKVKTFAEFIHDWYGKKVVPFEQEPDFADTHKYGYALVDAKGKVTKVINRTNPNAKWDWYQIGGRWAGYFKLKVGANGKVGTPGIQAMNKNYQPPSSSDSADQLTKGAIDAERMFEDAWIEAGVNYDLFMSIVGDAPPNKPWSHFLKKGMKPRPGKKRIAAMDKARKDYHAQARLEALKQYSIAHSHEDRASWFEADDFLCSKLEYQTRAKERALAPYAYIIDSKWYGKGKMGWFGMGSGEMDQEKWNAQFNQMFQALPDDTQLTLVDCHI